MRRRPPFPVTQDNLSLCWKAIDRMRCKAQRKSRIAGIGGFVSNLCLLFSILFAVNALIYSQFHGPYHDFLATVPFFTDAWDLISGLLLKSGDSMSMQAGKLLLGSYGVSIAVFFLLAVVITLVYHPKSCPVPDGTYAEQTVQLAGAAREARDHSYKTRLSTSILSMLLVIVSSVVLFLAYVFYRNDAESVMALLQHFPTKSTETNCLLYVMAGYFICGIFSWVLLLLTRPLYRYEFPYDYVVQAEAAAIFALEPGIDLSDEERLDQAAEFRERAIGLEFGHGYRESKTLFFKGALLGDVSAMEHYARRCLLDHMHDSARYWLKRCVASGKASQEAKTMLRRMRLHQKHNVRYLQEDPPLLSRWKKIAKSTLQGLGIVMKLLILLLTLAAVLACIVLLKTDMDLSVFSDLSQVLKVLTQ